MGVAEALERVVAALPGGGEARSGQREMAEAVEAVFADGGKLVVQAGTGVGKGMGYLVPAILSGRTTPPPPRRCRTSWPTRTCRSCSSIWGSRSSSRCSRGERTTCASRRRWRSARATSRWCSRTSARTTTALSAKSSSASSSGPRPARAATGPSWISSPDHGRGPNSASVPGSVPVPSSVRRANRASPRRPTSGRAGPTSSSSTPTSTPPTWPRAVGCYPSMRP